jgi:hypothetical protein
MPVCMVSSSAYLTSAKSSNSVERLPLAVRERNRLAHTLKI